MDRTKLLEFQRLVVAISHVLMVRLDPHNGILVPPSVDENSESTSPKPLFEEFSGPLGFMQRIPTTFKEMFTLLESNFKSLNVPNDLLVLFDGLNELKMSLLRAVHKEIVVWFANFYKESDLPKTIGEVDWSKCPYGSAAFEIYSLLDGSTDTLLPQCLDFMTHTGSKAKKAPIPSLEPKATASITPIKPTMSNRAKQEASSSNALPQVSLVKPDPLAFAEVHDINNDLYGLNLDGHARDDNTGRSPGSLDDDRSMNWSEIFSCFNSDDYQPVIDYLISFYEIPERLKVYPNRPVQFQEFSKTVSDFILSPSVQRANLVLWSGRSLASFGVDPKVLFDTILGLIYPSQVNELHALSKQFHDSISYQWKNNGYVFLAFWLCLDYFHIFGEFHPNVPSDLRMDDKETIFAFWNRVVRQGHLFVRAQTPAEMNARKYDVFITGLRDSIRDTVRRKLESIYDFDNIPTRRMLEKTRGVEHLMIWSVGLNGINGIDKTNKWLTLNESGFISTFAREIVRKGEAASSWYTSKKYRPPVPAAKHTGSSSDKPRFEDTSRRSHATPKATSSSSTAKASSSASVHPSSSTRPDSKPPNHRSHGRGRYRE